MKLFRCEMRMRARTIDWLIHLDDLRPPIFWMSSKVVVRVYLSRLWYQRNDHFPLQAFTTLQFIYSANLCCIGWMSASYHWELTWIFFRIYSMFTLTSNRFFIFFTGLCRPFALHTDNNTTPCLTKKKTYWFNIFYAIRMMHSEAIS